MAIAQPTALLKAYLDSKFDEARAREVFDQYYSKTFDEALSIADLRRLLFDLLEAGGFACVVPDSRLQLAVKDLVLNYEDGKESISWIEWKSYFVYLQNAPLTSLLKVITTNLDKESLETAKFYRLVQKQNAVQTDVRELLAVLSTNNESTEVAVYQDLADFAIYVCALKVEGDQGLPSLKIVEDTYDITAINLPNFPPVARKFDAKSIASAKIASAYVKAKTGIATTTEKVKSWDAANYQVFSKVETARVSAVSTFTKLWSDFSSSERVVAASAAAQNGLSSAKAAAAPLVDRGKNLAMQVDEKVGVTAKVKNILENPTIKMVQERSTQAVSTATTGLKDFSKDVRRNVRSTQSNELSP